MTEIICRIGMFVLCAQVLVHFRPKPVYEKYFKLLVSAMLLAQLLQPFLNLWGGGERLEERVEAYAEILDKSLEDAANGSRESVRLLEERLAEQGFAAKTENTGSGETELNAEIGEKPDDDSEEIRIEWEEIGEIKVE